MVMSSAEKGAGFQRVTGIRFRSTPRFRAVRTIHLSSNDDNSLAYYNMFPEIAKSSHRVRPQIRRARVLCDIRGSHVRYNNNTVMSIEFRTEKMISPRVVPR